MENFPDDIPSLATYGNHQIEQLSERYVHYGYMTVEEGMNARDEWPQLKASIHNLKKSISKTSRKINLSLSILSQLLVGNPPNIISQAATERGHASVDLVVTKQRSLLSEENIQHLLRVKHNTKGICHYDPVPAIKFWSASGPKHLSGHSLHARKSTSEIATIGQLLEKELEPDD